MAFAKTGKHTLLPYRRDVDGLRAVAVLLVLVFHAFPKLCASGFVGVDVFFVISGFLITATLLKDLRDDKFSLTEFYGRRFRRIIPAMSLVLAALTLFAFLAYPALDFKRLGTHLVAGATFTSNLRLMWESGYFDSAAERKPLLHLWSLGIEEQFYLGWPILLYFLAQRRAWLFRSVVLLGVASFLVNVIRVKHHPGSTFYLLPTRFWELLIGCGLALKIPVLDPVRSRARDLESIAGLGLILGSAFLMKDSRTFPGAWALLPTAGAALLIHAGPLATINRSLLSNRFFVFLGLISYPLYLWHWPLLASLRIVSVDQAPSAEWILGALVLSGLLAYLTWRCVELPIQRRFRSARPMIAWTLAGMAALCGVGLWIDRGNLTSMDERRFPQAYVLQKYLQNDPSQIRDGKCFIDVYTVFKGFDPECSRQAAGKPIDVFLIGDSLAAYLYPGLQDALAGTKMNLIQLTASRCPPLTKLSAEVPAKGCAESNRYIYEKIRAIRPEVVILFSGWISHADFEGFDSWLQQTARDLKELKVKRAILLGQSPWWTPSLPEMLEHKFLRKGLEIPLRTRTGVYERTFEVDRQMKKALENSSLEYVSLVDALCNEEGCLTRAGDDLATDLLFWDNVHMTRPGAQHVSRTILMPRLR